jgi:hypothetical protein
VNVTDARLWHPWLRINRVLRVMLQTRWSAEAWAKVRVEFRKALAITRLDDVLVWRGAGPRRDVRLDLVILEPRCSCGVDRALPNAAW